MRLRLLLFLCLLVAIGLVLFADHAQGSPSPKKRTSSSGGSRGSSSKRTASSITSSKKKSKGSSRGSYYAEILRKRKASSITSSKKKHGSSKKRGGYKPYKSKASKKSFGKNIKKAVAFGAGAYIGAKVAKKLTKGFAKIAKGVFLFSGVNYNLAQWRQFSDVDGWLCRNDKDCDWIDPQLGCHDRSFNIQRVNAAWPWKAQLKGQCTCNDRFIFNQEEGSCGLDPDFFSASATLATWAIAVIIVAVIIGCLCCYGCCFFIKKVL